MNFSIYMEIAGDDEFRKSIVKASSYSDTIGIVLRMHMLCELLTEAWICAACSQKDLFADGEERIRIDCQAKIKMARNLKLPKPLYNAMKVINKIRNKFAHQSSVVISTDEINSLSDNLLNMPNHGMLLNSDDFGLRTFNADGTLKLNYAYKNAPPEIKLLILSSKVFYLTSISAAQMSVTETPL